MGPGSEDEREDRRRRQRELYGEPVADLSARLASRLGLDAPAVAATIGVSEPMLATVRDLHRARLGNPVATARLVMLRALADRVDAGDLDPAGVADEVARVAGAAGTPATLDAALDPAHDRRTDLHAPPVGLTAAALRAARERVAPYVRPTPALRWPLLERHTGTETWVKHENHTPTGAFKVRGGLNFVARLLSETAPGDLPAGLVSASRGNHSQSLAYAGRAHGVPVTIVVPEGNSVDKNAATEALGADLVVHGADFQEAVEHAEALAAERGLMMVSSFHPWLVEGVATYAAELHEDVPDLDVVYVPVGMGSGAVANIAVRDLLGLATEVVGVVADAAPAYALSFAAGEPVPTERADTFVDGVACRSPHPDAVAALVAGADRVLRIGEDAAAEAMALMFRCTHNLAEPAGALALAGLLADRERVAGRRVAVVHTGGNADFDVLERALRG